MEVAHTVDSIMFGGTLFIRLSESNFKMDYKSIKGYTR